MISAYFLNHGHMTVIPHQLEDSFRDMVDCGFDAVAISALDPTTLPPLMERLEAMIRTEDVHNFKNG